MTTKLKWVFKIILRFFGVILFFILLYIVAAVSLSFISVNSDFVQHADNDGIVIYILTNGVHTDLVLPVKNDIKDWTAMIEKGKPYLTDTALKYVAFGWGDKGFYIDTPTWADLKFSTAFKALFYLSSSAMHVTLYKELSAGVSCRSISISKESYEKLVHFIDSSFDKKDGQYQMINCITYGDNDIFYEASGKFNLFYTCNSWTNEGLKSSGLKACFWTPFDKPILSKYD